LHIKDDKHVREMGAGATSFSSLLECIHGLSVYYHAWQESAKGGLVPHRVVVNHHHKLWQHHSSKEEEEEALVNASRKRREEGGM
jgi:hypothetical protein